MRTFNFIILSIIPFKVLIIKKGIKYKRYTIYTYYTNPLEGLVNI